MTPKEKYYENISNTVIKALDKRQMEGFYCKTKEDALKKALELIPKGSSISYGGSETVNEIGIKEALKSDKYNLIIRENAKTPEEQRKVNGEICMSDFFLMSTNAITVDGELINIDGRGNRVSFLCFGPQNVIIFAGMNKIVATAQEGINRARNIASPPNTVRLGLNTPCSVTGKCGDCFSPQCICSQIVITRRSGIKGRIKVILVGEELGF